MFLLDPMRRGCWPQQQLIEGQIRSTLPSCCDHTHEKRVNTEERERQRVESERNASKGATKQAALEGWSTQELPRYVPLALPIKQMNRHANHPAKTCSPAKPRPLRLLPD